MLTTLEQTLEKFKREQRKELVSHVKKFFFFYNYNIVLKYV